MPVTTDYEQSQAARSQHLEFLYEGIFQTQTKWPHFSRMLEDIVQLADAVLPNQTILCLSALMFMVGIVFLPRFFPKEHLPLLTAKQKRLLNVEAIKATGQMTFGVSIFRRSIKHPSRKPDCRMPVLIS